MRAKGITLFLSIFFVSALVAKDRKHAPITIDIFENTPILFNPNTYQGGVTEQNGVIYIANGRIVLKKITVPKLNNYTEAEISISLTSNGDRWDKTGSCFVIPKESVINMIDIANDNAQYPSHDESKYEKLKGIVSGEEYLPTVELMRFMTPFGVGHYSDNNDEVSTSRRPVYVDGWADKVEWKQDITDLYTTLEGEVYVGIFIDTWTEEGYKVDAQITLTESAVKGDKKQNTKILPLINTVYYIGQGHPDIFSRQDVEIPFTIPKGAKNISLKYITTGHGGHSGGDEFRPQTNILYIDNNEILSFLPWRTDCASFRRFNPTSGVWLRERKSAFISSNGTREEKVVEEPLASSDLSRSNWCPGSDVPPVQINLPELSNGNHILRISIPESKSIEGDKLNHWLVSAYLAWEE